MKEMDVVAMYLNRDCPRNCIQCGISDRSKRPMSFEQWRDIFQIFREYYNTKFFIVLGVEPLLLGDEFVKIVKWWNENGYFYGLYSTSPQVLFDKYKKKLLDVGVNNWSCGIDSMPGFPNNMTWKKTMDGMNGLKWMSKHGVATFTLTTITNANLSYIADILQWCHRELPTSMNSLNPVEWKKDEYFDFFSYRHQMEDLIIPEAREWEVRFMCERVKALSYQKGWNLQVEDDYLAKVPLCYSTLNHFCGGNVGMGIDCDGSLRRCGYNKGVNIANYNVWDIPENSERIYADWMEDVNLCEGCAWNLAYFLKKDYEILVPNSKYYLNRWKDETSDNC